MTILEFINLFPGYDFSLIYFIENDGSLLKDPEYCYYGLTDDFEMNMSQYDWIFDFELSDFAVRFIQVRHSLVQIVIYVN